VFRRWKSPVSLVLERTSRSPFSTHSTPIAPLALLLVTWFVSGQPPSSYQANAAMDQRFVLDATPTKN
jgi:hypothetical protein